MIDRMQAGELPPRPHTAMRGEDGSLHYEHCITRAAFDGPYTIAYRLGRPQAQRPIDSPVEPLPLLASPRARLRRRHFRTAALGAALGSSVSATTPLLFHSSLCVSLCRPADSDPYYLAHGDADVLFFIIEGEGTLRSELGDVVFSPLDYLYVPRGMLYRFALTKPLRMLRFDFSGGVGLLRKHRNALGQLRMDAPYGHRDFRRPIFRGPVDEGIRELVVLRRDGAHAFRYEASPLDVVGWDGSLYPFAFPILAFRPRVGALHLPPDTNGTFEADDALVSSFVPRPLDFGEDAVPCPYPHSSLDCDELLFYVRGEFTSRRGIEPGSLSLHPAGIPHGPHPGAYEQSIGVKETAELAVMLDSFAPLSATTYADALEDMGYHEGG